MSHNITIEGGASVRLPTAGKYCDRDIVITATGGGGGNDEAFILKSIEGDYANGKVTDIGDYAFYGQTKLSSVSFPIATQIGAHSFAECTNMETASLPLVTQIKTNAFLGCKSLKKADFPLARTIDGYVFRNCFALSEANVPLVTTVTDCMFDMPNGANNVLTKLDFPKVTNIKAYAFRSCKALTALILRANNVATLANINALAQTPITNGTGYVYVPRTLVDGYKAATNWSTYAAQFRALEDYTVDGTITGALDETKI